MFDINKKPNYKKSRQHALAGMAVGWEVAMLGKRAQKENKRLKEIGESLPKNDEVKEPLVYEYVLSERALNIIVNTVESMVELIANNDVSIEHSLLEDSKYVVENIKKLLS